MKPITPNDANIHCHEIITAYKCTREDGTDYRTGKVRYVPGEWITELNADLSDAECGPGLHVSPTIRQTCGYINTTVRGRRARFFEVAIRMEDLISCGDDKLRCLRLYVVREVPFAEAFPDCAQWPERIEAVRADMATWKDIPWLKPPRTVTPKEVGDLFQQWHKRMQPFWQQGRDVPPLAFRVVRSAADAVVVVDAAAADADAAAAAAAAAAADADAVVDAAAADADAVVVVDAAAADADAAAAAADALRWHYSTRWYVRPRFIMWRWARWNIYKGEAGNPWAPLMAMFRLGARPIGYSRNRETNAVEFVVYAPEVK